MLEVGIESEEGRQMFSEEENEFLCSPVMGAIAMAAGIGRIGSQNRRSVSVEEATFRFQMSAKQILNESPFTQEFVQRMADAGWSSNVSNQSFEVWALRHARASLDWASDEFTQRMMRVYENAVESMEALDRIVVHLATTCKAREIHYLIPNHMWDEKLMTSNSILRWDGERAYLMSINKEEEE
jgi:hypothetical protein